LQLEDVQGFCDPNPTEYMVAGEIETEQSVVFYWGLHPSRRARFNVDSVEGFFWKNITNGYQGKVGKMRLTIVQASELPSSNTSKAKDTKARYHQRMPLFVQHHLMPNHFMGYITHEGDHPGS